MLECLTPQPPDPLLAVLTQFRADPRPGKIDLGIGVYRDADGRTPVLAAVKEAEAHLLGAQQTKAYVGPSGDLAFIDLAAELTFGAGRPPHLAGLQVPGGTAALRAAADLLARAGARRIWLGTPSWANHEPVFRAARLEVALFPFFDVATERLDFARLAATLEKAEPGEAVLLQACCHNPTGADLGLEQWREAAAIMARRGLVPLIDVAYQGLGTGLEDDVAGARAALAGLPEALVAVSFSKNFGLYRERTGALFVMAPGTEARTTALSNMLAMARANYSMPPDHGAAVVRTILENAALRASWHAELVQMCARINGIRRRLATLGRRGPCDLAPLAHQRGMFSLLQLTTADVSRLRDRHAIYMPGSGRINVAGLRADQIERFAEALSDLPTAEREAA